MWAQIMSALTGLWLMAAPAVLGHGDLASDNGHIVGPVIVTFAVVAWWEATRVVRKWNYPLGFWLLLAPWVLGYDSSWAIASDMISGALVLVFSSFSGKVGKHYGGGWASLWKSDPAHSKKTGS